MYQFSRFLFAMSALLLSIQVPAQHVHTEPKTNVGIVLYPGFESLDVYGPVQMWGYIADFKLHFIAEQAGPVRSAQGTQSYAEYDFETAPKLDIVMVPGGFGTKAQLQNPAMLKYLSKAHSESRFTTSVCTGSALLAKIGALDGEKATTNKRFFFLSEQQSDNVEWVENARWVESGKTFTSSGVSAGTDMALGLIEKLYGKQWATGIASSLEYTWHEDAGNDPYVQYTNRLLKDKNGLISAIPGADSNMENAPRWIWLFYEKTPDSAKAEIRLVNLDNDREEIPLQGLHTMGNDDLMIGIEKPLEAGQYEVRWSTHLEDEQTPRQGSYRFSVTD